MKRLLMIATLSLVPFALVAQKTQPFLSSYDELHEAQQKEIMRTWNVVGVPYPFLSSYDELHGAEAKKTMRTWDALEVVRGTTAGEQRVPNAPKDYLDQNIEQINMNAAIKTALEF